MKLRDSFHPYALTAIIFWSVGYPLTRIALRHFSAFPLGLLRYIIASLVLVPVVLAARMKLPKKSDIGWFFLSGAVGFSLYMPLFNKGAQAVSSATSSIIIATAPVMTALMARLAYREKPGVFKWIATAVEFLGVAVLTLMNGDFSLNSGLVWLLLAAACLSLYNLLQRRLTQSYSVLQACAYSIFAGTIMLFVSIPDTVTQTRTAPPTPLACALVLGLFSSAIAYMAWAQALKKAEHISSVSNYMFVTPFLASLFGFLLAGEVPDASTIAGGAIITAGMLIFNFGEKLHTSLLNKDKTV